MVAKNKNQAKELAKQQKMEAGTSGKRHVSFVFNINYDQISVTKARFNGSCISQRHCKGSGRNRCCQWPSIRNFSFGQYYTSTVRESHVHNTFFNCNWVRTFWDEKQKNFV
jgi:hypothetical protein